MTHFIFPGSIQLTLTKTRVITTLSTFSHSRVNIKTLHEHDIVLTNSDRIYIYIVFVVELCSNNVAICIYVME